MAFVPISKGLSELKFPHVQKLICLLELERQAKHEALAKKAAALTVG